MIYKKVMSDTDSMNVPFYDLFQPGIPFEEKKRLLEIWRQTRRKDDVVEVADDLPSGDPDLDEFLLTHLNATEKDKIAAAAFFGIKEKQEFMSHLQYLLSSVDKHFAPWQESDTSEDPFNIRSKLKRLGIPFVTPQEKLAVIDNIINSKACEKETPMEHKIPTAVCTLPIPQQAVEVYGGAEADADADEDEYATYNDKKYKVSYSAKGAFIVVSGKRLYLSELN